MLSKIDNLIENAKKFNSTEQFLNKLSELVIDYLEIDVSTRKYQSILKKELAQNKKRFIAFCLLRVYNVNSKIVTNKSINHSVINFLEQAVPDVLKKIKITAKTETWEKENLLESYVGNIEKDLNNKINIDVELSKIKSFKNTYLSSINHSNNKALLTSFFGNNNIKDLTEKAFNSLIKYFDSDNINKFKYYSLAIEKINNCIDTSQDVNTKYINNYVVKPFSKLKTQITRDFENNPYAKPAKLEIKKTEKKYPILPNVTNQIKLVIENLSTGYAYDTIVKINEATNIKLENNEIFIGTIETSSIIKIDYVGQNKAKSFLLDGIIEWRDYDNKVNSEEFILELIGQNTSVDWEKLEQIEPYDLEPVTTEDEFIGRKQIINLLKNVKNKLKSSYVFGQRRVGKTSIVKTLQTSLMSEKILVIYFEAGDWNDATSPQESMNDLGKKICKKIIKHSEKFKHLSIPNFNGSFNKITDFLDDVTDIDIDFKCLIILDEFDRISSTLLNQGDIARSFMLTIRSISNREQFGFILVGGEKLEYILSQWQEFNKFRPVRVDYFEKKSEWEDFVDLVKKPIDGLLEISDKAIDYIYNQTSGNPYFTKKICIEMYSLMVENRDSHITESEAIKATAISLDSNKIGATDFSHFWKDGIKEKEEKEDEISIQRRKVLLSIGQLIKSKRKVFKQLIIDKSIENGLNELEAQKTLEDFVQRKIIKVENKEYKFVVNFFKSWLINNGLDLIITTFKEEQGLILRKKYENEIKIKHSEINALTQNWQTYRGNKITTDKVREWIEQFGDYEEQRLIFNLLLNLKLFTNIEIRQKMEDLFTEVRKEIKKSQKHITIQEKKRKRDDIIISYLDRNPAKSGPEYNKIFTETNNIYKDNSVEPSKILEKINKIREVNAIVFIDDFVGTGNSMIENIETVILPIKQKLKDKEILIIIGIITGFQDAKYKIEQFCSRKNIPAIIKLLEPLDNRNKCFSDNSLIFPNYLEREKAKNICKKIGVNLEKKNPLGYGNSQCLIVFPNNCPNNTLPIIWKKSNNWIPLFERQ